MNRRSLLALSTLVVSLGGFLPLAQAREIRPKSNALHADLVGERSGGGSVDVFRGPDGFVKAQVWRVPASEVRLVLGDWSVPLALDPETGAGALVIDARAGQRMPRLREGSIVAVAVAGRIVMKGELTAR